MLYANRDSLIRALLSIRVGTPLLIIMILAMMVLPLPAFVLDLLFTFNIALSLVVLFGSIYCTRPLDFAIFPTVLLMSTLLRLSLNVASTRAVLLNGHTGTEAAGQVVKSFGEVVIGGNYTVGLVVFAILVVINFVVVTKGAGRVSEVSARFTLDSMPGKQMAIDADLNAGLLTQAEAKLRRQEVASEADFYGSMDGASKFVRGDAIAGILILFINILGGLAIGIFQHGMSVKEASEIYSLLTIGDGLVAQIPSLLLSTAAAIIVTRVSREQDIGGEIVTQLFNQPKILMITGIIIFGLGIIPGMPHIAFITISVSLMGYSYFMQNKKMLEEERQLTPELPANTASDEEENELSWNDVNPVDLIGIEVGYRLISLVDKAQGGVLLSRLKGVRKKLSQDLGFLIPAVHIRDNLDISPSHYKITLMGVTMGDAEIHSDKHLAINSGQVFGVLDGIKTIDPAFGLEAIWIGDDQREHAQSLGYTVVDASTVIATHLSQILNKYAYQLLGHEEVQQLFDKLKQNSPKLVEELIPGLIPLSTVVKVLQLLLEENIPIRDIRSITEALAETAVKTKDPEQLTAAVRVALSRLIVQNIGGSSEELPIITLQAELEQLLQNSLQMVTGGGPGLEPGLAENMQKSLTQITERQEMMGQASILVVSPNLRRLLSRFVRNVLPNLHVLSFQELPDYKQIRVIGSVG
jgi:flagellar biosynthesis protein FlhA